MLEFSGLSKLYPQARERALADVSFKVERGEVMGFVGLNGAGKTTAIRVAAGSLLPTHGSVRVDEYDIVTDKVAASERLGVVAESPNFEPQAKALAHLRYLAIYNRIDRAAAELRGREVLRQVGLAGQESARLRTFSLGMKKRYAIAAAMLADPPNFLLDEVLNGLDPTGLVFTRGWLNELKRSGRSVLLSTHNLHEVQQLADRIAFIHQGRLLKIAPRSEVVSAGTTAIVITLDPLDAGAFDILSRFGLPEPMGPNVIALRNPTAEPPEIIQALFARQYRIAEIRREEASLEAYFLRLVQGAA